VQIAGKEQGTKRKKSRCGELTDTFPPKKFYSWQVPMDEEAE
jgi:hypothetical protein